MSGTTDNNNTFQEHERNAESFQHFENAQIVQNQNIKVRSVGTFTTGIALIFSGVLLCLSLV